MASVKEKVYSVLRENCGEFVSGEFIAEGVNVTRASVWKSINALKDDGFAIESVTNKGYRLLKGADVITKTGITDYLCGELKSLIDITVEKQVESTNKTVREKAVSGAAEGCFVVSGMQTSGKGRMGRSFFSPEDTGVYMSLLLRPGIKPEDAVLITTAAAVSVCEAMEKLGVSNPGIKWVNDIFVNDKKVCGILTEASFDIENNRLEYAVLGVGANIYAPRDGFPEELREIAGGIFEEEQDDLRNKFIAYFLNSFFGYYKNLSDRMHSGEYKKRCFVIGMEADVVSGESKRHCRVLDVDENCGLYVEFDNGECSKINSGEISLRPSKMS